MQDAFAIILMTIVYGVDCRNLKRMEVMFYESFV